MKMEITRTLYIGWEAKSYMPDGGDYLIRDCDPSAWNEDFKLLTTQQITIDVPEIDARGELVESLKRKKGKIIAKATEEATAIDEQIQTLLALPAA
jgi:uncharacterized protein YPO0396